MTNLADLWKWLWSDWGKPNFLTRAGIPRLVTTFLSFLLFMYLSYYLTMRYSFEPNKESFR